MTIRMHLLFVFVLGCAGPRQYGSFVADQGRQVLALAADATAKLTADYSPERYGIQLVDGAADEFGRAVSVELRKAGYEVREGRDAAAGALPVHYAVDHVNGTDLLRVTLVLQDRQLSRAYARTADGLNPVGPWTAAGGP